MAAYAHFQRELPSEDTQLNATREHHVNTIRYSTRQTPRFGLLLTP